MADVCAMKDCPSKASDPDRRFFNFPDQLTRMKTWAEACGRPDLANGQVPYYMRVCDLHFKKSDMLKRNVRASSTPLPYTIKPNEDKPVQGYSTNSIVLLNSENDAEQYSPRPGPSTSNDADDFKNKNASYKSQCKRLQKKILSLHNHKTINKIFNIVEFLLNIEILEKVNFVNSKSKTYALFLYLSGPSTYKVIRSSMSLPSEKELRKIDIGIDTVTSPSVTESLKTKITFFPEKDRHCTVCMKRIELKRFLYYRIAKDKVIGWQDINGNLKMNPATHAYVIVARGLRAKWEQPLSYCFVADEQPMEYIDSWLDQTVSNAMSIGYNVVAIVVDHEDFYDYFKNRVVSFVKPYYFLNGQKIYCIFDLPQLIISLRNLLMTHELQFLDDDGSKVVANWGTIRDLFTEYNVDDRCLLVPKLTKSHIYPGEVEKQELKYAAQIFSKSVSMALEMDGKRRGLQDTKMIGTQILVEQVNEVFDILNSSTSNHHNKSKNAFTGAPYQMRAIRQFMKFLTDVKPNDCFFEDQSFNCIYGLRMSIMSISIILRDLLPKGISSLMTHRFNLDAANRFFESVKRKSKSEKPTAVQFFKFYRQIFMTELMKYPRACKASDDVEVFADQLSTGMKKSLNKYMPDGKGCKSIEVHTVDYRFELPPTNGFRYMCWYLMKKCYEVHTCDNIQNPEFIFCDHDPRWLGYFDPPELFVKYILLLDRELVTAFGKNIMFGLGFDILNNLRCFRFSVCPCFPVPYLHKLFVRMRIFQIFRHNNRNFRDDSYQFSVDDNLSNTCPTSFHYS